MFYTYIFIIYFFGEPGIFLQDRTMLGKHVTILLG